MLSPKQSGVLECHLSHYFKNENYELCISAGFFVTGKKKIQSSVCWVRGSGDYDRKKKIQSSVWRVRDQLRPEKKEDTVVCLLGARFWRLRPEKKRYSRLSGGLCCCIVLVFGSGRKLAIFL